MWSGMRWDAWELVGLIGEGLFFARMLAQWIASEKVRKPVIPTAYWYMSLAGALILVLYAFHLGSFAVLLPQVVGIAFYARGLHLEYSSKRAERRRAEFGFDLAGYPWPELSVIIPVHNEERTLASTLERILAQKYPGGSFETVVALNGCSDGSREVAERFPVVVVEDAKSGMSFGKNLGAGAAKGSFLVFVDADTGLPPDALRLLAEAAAGHDHFIGTVAGKPDRGGGVVRVCFAIANYFTRRRLAHAPGGVMLMDRATFDRAGGFDESLPQGTSTDLIWRGLATGAEYVFVDSFKAETSIRRFEKTGIVSQLLSWRKNHHDLKDQRRDRVAARRYDDIR